MRYIALSALLAGTATSTVVLVGCATTPKHAESSTSNPGQGNVSYDLLPTQASSQMKLKKTEHAFGAQPTSRPDPIYPPSLTSQHILPLTVRIKAIIDEHGQVVEVRDLDASADAQHAMFVSACRDAVLRWTFSPMIVVNETDDGKGNISQTRSAKAFSQDYEFRFEVVQGAPTVSANR